LNRAISTGKFEIVAIISSGKPTIFSSTGNITSANDIAPNPIQQTPDLTLNVSSSYDSILAGFSALNASGVVGIIIAIGGAMQVFLLVLLVNKRL
jgi:hypothetical protein